MNINDLTKMQLVLLVLLVSFVTSFVTGIVTVALVEQAPPPITQTIQKVVERVKEFPAQITEQKPTQPKGEVSGKVIVITQEDQVISISQNSFPAVVSVMVSKGGTLTEKRQVPIGTGFFVSADGLIVTNHHMVEDSEADYSVTLNNGKNYPVKVLVRDSERDLAILKVDGSEFVFLALGDSSRIKIGQTAIAMASAFGEFQSAISVGVISGLKRNTTASSTGSGSKEVYEIIQTDAAVNPENSGGPLLDLAGSVIGVNFALDEGAEKGGLALPINLVKKLIADIGSKEIENEVKLE